MKERTLLSFKLISTHLVLIPILSVISLFIKRDLFLSPIITQTVLIIIFLSGYWEFPGLKTRLIYCISMEAVILLIFFYRLLFPVNLTTNWFIVLLLIIPELILLFELIKIFIVIFSKRNNPVEIQFPFRDGKYLVTDGGDSKLSRLMNYHFYSPVHKKNKTNSSMRFATDIVKLNAHSGSYMPLNNNDYAIFGEKVYCPFSGTVIKAENNIDDNIPYSGGYPYNTGNTIIIRNNNCYFLIGHLKKGSIIVTNGDQVNGNDLIAEAGNSGFTERPHIHMQLIYCENEDYWHGYGISITFKNKNLYKNRLIEI
jgi:hypothetical protein